MSKGDKEHQPVNIFWLVVLAAMAVVIIADIARADEISSGRDCAGKSSACFNSAGSDAIGIGFSSASFTSSISQCLATKSISVLFGALGKQGVSLNYHCMGLAYMQFGMIDAGAYMLCNAKEGPLSGMPDCESAVKQFRITNEVPVNTSIGSSYNEFEDLVAAELEGYQMMVSDMQAKLDNLAEPVQRTIVQPALTDSQRNQLEDLKQ